MHRQGSPCTQPPRRTQQTALRYPHPRSRRQRISRRSRPSKSCLLRLLPLLHRHPDRPANVLDTGQLATLTRRIRSRNRPIASRATAAPIIGDGHPGLTSSANTDHRGMGTAQRARPKNPGMTGNPGSASGTGRQAPTAGTEHHPSGALLVGTATLRGDRFATGHGVGQDLSIMTLPAPAGSSAGRGGADPGGSTPADNPATPPRTAPRRAPKTRGYAGGRTPPPQC